MCDVFSKRSDEIAQYPAELGESGPRAAGVAARATRTAKPDDSPDELLPRWLGELAAAGHEPRRLLRRVEAAARAYRPPSRPLDRGEIATLAADVLGPGSALGARKVFSRSDLLIALAPRLHGRPVSELDRIAGAVLADASVVPLLGVEGARERAFCPAWVLETEHAIARTVEALARAHAEPIPPLVTAAAIQDTAGDRGHPLSAAQAHAVRAICSPRRATVVVGVAGAGKTTTLEAAARAHEHAGWQVLGCATSGQAARTLGRETNVRSRTVTSLLWQLDHQKIRLDLRTLVVLDEAGMTADPDLQRLLHAIATAGAKVVLVGDPRQLGAVGPGGALDAVLARFPNAVVTLQDNLRQRDPAERAALAELRDGEPVRAVGWYAANRRIHARADRLDTLVGAVMAADLDRAAGHDTVLLAWRRRDVADLNRLARYRARAAGRLTGPDLEAPGGRRYAAGDPIVILTPDPERQLVTSQRAVVTAVDVRTRTVAATTDDGRSVVLDRDATASDRLDHAYATTIHRAQGMTVDRAHVVAAGGRRELGYVSLSRARAQTSIHVTADSAGQAAEDLERDWSSHRSARWVIDSQAHPDPQREPPEPISIAERLRRYRAPEPRGRSLGR